MLVQADGSGSEAKSLSQEISVGLLFLLKNPSSVCSSKSTMLSHTNCKYTNTTAKAYIGEVNTMKRLKEVEG